MSELEKVVLSFERAEKELAKGSPGKPSKIEELSLRDLMKNWSFVAPGCTEPEKVDELLMEPALPIPAQERTSQIKAMHSQPAT